MNQNISKHINLLITILSLSLIAGVALALKIDNADYIDFKPIVQPPCDEEGKMYYDITDKATYVCNGAIWIGTTVSGNISPATVTTTDGQLWLNDTDEEGNIYNTNYIYGYNDLRLHSSSSTINYSSIYLGDAGNKMITFYIDGDEKMKIDSAGDVIINQNLTVTGDTAINGALTITDLTCTGGDCLTGDDIDESTLNCETITGSTDLCDGVDAVGSSYWTQSGTNLYANDTGWNVGIGTLTPSGKLNVGGILRVGLITHDGGSTAGYGDKLYLSGGDDWTTYNSENSDSLWIARYNIASDQTELRINIGDRISDANDKLIIGTDDPTQGGWNYHLTIQANGNVGVGTIGPGNKLGITITANDAIPSLGSNGGSFGLFKSDGGTPGNYGFIMGVRGDGNVFQQVQRIDGTATAYDLLLQPSGGNVGIGTADPSVALHVNPQTNPSICLGPYCSAANGRFIISGSGGEIDLQDRLSGAYSGTDRWVIYNNSDLLRFYRGGDRITMGGDNATINMYASDNDTGTLTYSTNDRWEWSGGGFYIMNDTPTTWIYSTNIYLGSASADSIHTRGNVIYVGTNTSGRDGDLRITNYTGRAVSDGLKFYEGTIRVGEIGVEDTTWLRINQETAKNIYTPRYFRADSGLYVGDDEYIYRYGEDVIGTGDSLVVAGSVTASSFYYSSDLSLKKDIEELDSFSSVASILQLNPVEFKFKENNQPGLGFIAQDLEKVYPELVNTTDDEEGMKSINYAGLIAPLVKTVQEQNQRINKLEDLCNK